MEAEGRTIHGVREPLPQTHRDIVQVVAQPANGTHRPNAQTVLLWLADHGADHDEGIAVGIQTISRETELSTGVVSRELRSIVQGGLVRRQVGNQQNQPSRYWLTDRGARRAAELTQQHPGYGETHPPTGNTEREEQEQPW